MSPDALTGMEANLRFNGPETMFTRIFGRLTAWQNWIFQRPNAVGDKGALKVYGKGEKAAVRLEPRLNTIQGSDMSTINYSDKIPNNVNLERGPHAAARARAVAAELPQLVERHGPGRLARTSTSTCARRSASIPQGWAQFGHVKMPDYRWGIFLNPGDAEPQDPLRRPQGRGGLAGRARRAPRQPAPHHRHAGRHRAGVGRAAAPPGPHRSEPVRPAQPVPGQRRGRPPPVGDGLPAAQVLRPRRPRGSRGAAASAAVGDEDNPRILRRLQREDARLAHLLHVHVLHRPRRQVPAVARWPRAASIRSRARPSSC